ncbi:hypothetical protein KP003_20040 [Geomonas nitrogeniifigens]|uniref:hypothetical protein n=1 Tax=Geomonas diazotrophica TaxID=2843197 RepID=UPI001C2C48D5|nr:hypothetical protein [Geomonas nitrogeniifigens]QXE86611.1 hypothetical protein KP003_20040 [Geomonas nitrogeniifigens]
MRALKKQLQDYKKATNGEPNRLLVIEAMEKIIAVVEEHLASANSRWAVMTTMRSFLQDANGILDEGVKNLRFDSCWHEQELEKYNRLIDKISAWAALPSPAQALLMPLPGKPPLGTDTDMQQKEI